VRQDGLVSDVPHLGRQAGSADLWTEDPALALSHGTNSVPRISRPNIQRGARCVADGADRLPNLLPLSAAPRALLSEAREGAAPTTGPIATITHFDDACHFRLLIADFRSEGHVLAADRKSAINNRKSRA
jgi:hypothetical protein